jgi:hypothetical protein
MAPLPENNTPRYWVRYRASGREHEMMFRWNEALVEDASDRNAFVARVAALLADAAPLLPTDFEVLSARWSNTGQNFSVPYSAPASPTGTGGLELAEAPAFITFVGRTGTGRRWKLTILGVALSPVAEAGNYTNYRVEAGENATVTTVIGNLAGWPELVGIDGYKPDVYGYANLGYNAYWQREVRG